MTRPAVEDKPDATAEAFPLFNHSEVVIPPHVEEQTQGKPLGAALRKLYVSMQKHKAREAAKTPEPLPLIDEEELAGIADSAQHERENVLMLTPWAEDKRAAPNIIYRSALFPALNTRQGRRYVENHRVYSVSSLEVVFTGKQFDQTDLDVYLEILNFAKAIPLGQPVKFSAYAMLKKLGRCTGKSDHKWLHSVLVRLRGGTVELVTNKSRYFGGLIEGVIRDEITKHYEVIINPNYAVMFGFGLWSAIDLEQRRALDQNSTAKALHAYYSTHAAPGFHRYDTLAGIVGLEGKNRRDVKASLIRAHEELKRVGFLVSYDAKPNGIEVKATMTPSQQQHVIKSPKPSANHLPRGTG